MQIIERIRKGKDKVAPGEGAFGIAPRYRITSKRGRVAKILKTFLAVTACAVCSAKPANTYARAKRNVRRGAADNLAHDLVARNQPHLLGRQLSFDDVEIRATHTASPHAQQHMTGPDARIGHIRNLKRAFRNWSRRCEDGSFHGGTLADAMMAKLAPKRHRQRYANHAVLF